MKKYSKLIIGVVAFVAFIIITVVMYNQLSDDYNNKGKSDSLGQSSEMKAKDFEVIDSKGEKVMLSEFFEKPVVLNFWASYCGPCKSEFPDFQAAYEKYGDDIQFVMVNLTDGSRETLSKAQEFIESNGYTMPVFYDTNQQAAYAYQIYSIPQTYFIKTDGTIAGFKKSMISYDELEDGIERILENRK